MKHTETDYRSQPYIERTFQGERIDPSGFSESRVLDCTNIAHGKIDSELNQPSVASIGGRGIGSAANSSAAFVQPGLRVLPYDEEFYELFSEIRLP